VRIALTIVDTPGFGDNIDNEFACVDLAYYTFHYSVLAGSKKLSDISSASTMISWQKSRALSATRVSATTVCMPCSTLSRPLATRAFPHCHNKMILQLCRLREMDIELMRRLSPRVNVIPVIGKADTLTPSELKGFKKRVRRSAPVC
jgi:cell division control protein 11